MKKTKRLALLCLLLVASVGSAVVAQATGVMQRFGNIEEAEINIQTASVSLILTPEDRQRVTDMVLMDPQIQELLEGADEYTIEVSEVFDVNEISFNVHETVSGVIELVPREGVAQATIEINNDYGEEFGVQVITVTVDLVTEEITKTSDRTKNSKRYEITTTRTIKMILVVKSKPLSLLILEPSLWRCSYGTC